MEDQVRKDLEDIEEFILGDLDKRRGTMKKNDWRNYPTSMFQCQRCRHNSDTEGWYCENCVGSVEVDFDFVEDGYNRKGEKVCLWCYNQLKLKSKESK